jgi:hypothetical protein
MSIEFELNGLGRRVGRFRRKVAVGVSSVADLIGVGRGLDERKAASSPIVPCAYIAHGPVSRIRLLRLMYRCQSVISARRQSGGSNIASPPIPDISRCPLSDPCDINRCVEEAVVS